MEPAANHRSKDGAASSQKARRIEVAVSFTSRWTESREFCLMESDGVPAGAAQIGHSPGEVDPDAAIGDDVYLAVVEMMYVADDYRGKDAGGADSLVDEVLRVFPEIYHTGIQSSAGRKLGERRGIPRHPVVKRVKNEKGKMVPGQFSVDLSDGEAERKGRELLAKAVKALE